MAADVLSLMLAFVLTEYISGARDAGQVSVRKELLLFLLVLPGGLWQQSYTVSTTGTRSARIIRRAMISSASSM